MNSKAQPSVERTANPRVLLVEDNEELAENLADILSEANVESSVVMTAEEAIELLEAEPFDGVITDFRLPGMSGGDLIETLRRGGHRVPIAVVTAYANDETIDRVETLGALEVLGKPFKIERLLQLVDEFARRRSRVLVVEDNQDLADNIADILRERDLEPVVASTVEGALRQRHLPCLALIDLRLEDGSGLDAIRPLLARDPSLRVLVTTGYPSDLESALSDRPELGAVEQPVLEKPFSMETLLERIEVAPGCTKPRRSS